MRPDEPDGLIVVTGAGGLLGTAVVSEALRRGRAVRAVIRLAPAPRGCAEVVSCDLTERSAEDAVFGGAPVAAVVHAAASADVDWCEENPAEARRVNADVPARLARAARRSGVPFLHVSTDAVFDGERGSYREDDAPAPVNEYGRTKREGELGVLAADPNAVVARTNFVGFSPSGRRGLFEWMLGRLRRGEEVPAFRDVVFSPLSAPFLAGALLDLVTAGAAGLLHVAGAEAVTKLAFARRVAAAFGIANARILEQAVSRAGLRAPRPCNVSLDSSRAAGLLGRPLERLDDVLARLLLEERAGGRPDTTHGG